MKSQVFTGINIQWPISQEIIKRKKTIETRTYPLPPKYLDVPLLIIETPGSQGKFAARVVAIIKITKSFEYKTKSEFYADFKKHLVDPKSKWAWREKKKYGWEIEILEILSPPLKAPLRKGIKFTKNICLKNLSRSL